MRSVRLRTVTISFGEDFQDERHHFAIQNTARMRCPGQVFILRNNIPLLSRHHSHSYFVFYRRQHTRVLHLLHLLVWKD